MTSRSDGANVWEWKGPVEGVYTARPSVYQKDSKFKWLVYVFIASVRYEPSLANELRKILNKEH